MPNPKLGKFEKVELRDIWNNEAQDFTPWLAQEEHLKVLGDTLGLDIELEGTEQSVGPFSVDILAIDNETDRKVVIENQIEKTDHKHLGQLLTYAAGYNAINIIWVSKKMCPEHKKALDWLNENTVEDVNFFAVEVEVWKIGESLPAPKFNIVATPNNWVRDIKKKSRNSKNDSPSEVGMLHFEFWDSLKQKINNQKNSLDIQSSSYNKYIHIRFGRSGFYLSLYTLSSKGGVGCDLVIKKDQNPGLIEFLLKHKRNIENATGKLDWRPNPENNRSRIGLSLKKDFQSKENWKDIHEWYLNHLPTMYSIFSDYLRQYLAEASEAA